MPMNPDLIASLTQPKAAPLVANTTAPGWPALDLNHALAQPYQHGRTRE